MDNESNEYKLRPLGDMRHMPNDLNSEFDKYKLVTINESGSKLVQLDYSKQPPITAFSNYPSDWEENTYVALQALRSPDPDAAVQLLGLMQAISEQCYCAGWITGNDYSLYEIMQAASHKQIIVDTQYGMRKIEATYVDLMITLY